MKKTFLLSLLTAIAVRPRMAPAFAPGVAMPATMTNSSLHWPVDPAIFEW